MNLFIKSAPWDWKIALEIVEKLEKEGVEVRGIEIQMLDNSVPEKVYEATENFRAQGLKVGIHSPFPSLFEEAKAWVNVANTLEVDYFLVHAGSRHGFCSIRKEAEEIKKRSRVPVVFENMSFWENRKGAFLWSPIAVAQLGDVALDIPHTIYNFRHGKLAMPLEEIVEGIGKCIKVVHVADGEGIGEVIGKGSRDLREILQALFRHSQDAFFVGEPKDGHLNNGEGHFRNALGMWNLWLEFKDNGKLV